MLSGRTRQSTSTMLFAEMYCPAFALGRLPATLAGALVVSFCRYVAAVVLPLWRLCSPPKGVAFLPVWHHLYVVGRRRFAGRYRALPHDSNSEL